MTPSDSADPLFADTGELGELIRSRDWSRTPLGPPAKWPHSLRTAVRIMLMSRYAMWLGWGPELTFLYNDAYRVATLGKKHPWAIGASARQVWEEIWPSLKPRVDSVMQQQRATWDEGLLLFLERSGFPEETYHTFSYSPLPDDSGALGGLLCVVTEETERVIGERRLALLRDFAARLSTTKTEADVFAAVEGCLQAESRDMPFSLTYLFEDEGRRARLRSQTALPSGHPAAPSVVDVALSEWPLGEALRQGTPVTVETLPPDVTWPRGPWDRPPSRALVVPIAQQGQERPAGVFIVGLNPYRSLDDSYRDFVSLFIGQLSAGLSNAHAYEEERRRAEALAELDRAKTAFFSNVSHEFRTPLTLLLGPVEDMLAGNHGALTPRLREDTEIVHRNAVRLLRLVNSLLDFSRIEAGRIQASYEPLDLAALTQDLASVFRSAIERAGLTLTVECPPLPEPVHVDRDMWEKIVLNLLSNAFKFTFEGGIHVSLHAVDGEVVLRVQDTGVGIPTEEMPRLFERFHRVEGTRARTHEGSGIGLALVQELAKLHGGSISAESTLGKGTTFTVRMPRGSAHLPRERLGAPRGARATPQGAVPFVEEALRWVPDASAPERPPPPIHVAGGTPVLPLEPPTQPGRATILLADDNADMREYLRRLLSERWEVVAVPDGAAALEVARARPPTLVLTDVMMPNLDGFGLLRELRANPATRALPVILLSARAGEEAKIEGLQAGADDYLIKPFSARELMARVETHLELSRLRIAAEQERAKLQGLFLNAPVGICVLRGPEHVFELANPPYLRLIGERQVAGKTIRQVFPDLVDQGFFELLDEVYRSGVPYTASEARLRLDTASGTQESFVNFVYQPSFDADGRVDGILVFVIDVTEQVQGRQRLVEAHEVTERARVQAEAAVQVRDDFLSIASHELRTPLTTLVLQADGVLRMLQKEEGGFPARLFDKVRKVRQQADRLEQLVHGLMDVSRLTSGNLVLRWEDVDLAAMARDIQERFADEATRAGSRLTLRAEGPVVGRWDPLRLDQVITNLVSNAIKYGEGKAIEVLVESTARLARLTVRDHGMGIAVEDQSRVFERFERAASARHFGGFGLGLWIVRRMVEAMGGTVSLSSSPGAGSTFVVELPRSA